MGAKDGLLTGEVKFPRWSLVAPLPKARQGEAPSNGYPCASSPTGPSQMWAFEGVNYFILSTSRVMDASGQFFFTTPST